MYLASYLWDPDVVFGLMSWAMACDGFQARIGYLHSEPMTVSWDQKANNLQHQVWAVYIERDDIKFLAVLPERTMMAHISQGFGRQAAGAREPTNHHGFSDLKTI